MIEIKNNFLESGVLPELGGALSYLKYNGIDILRPFDSVEKSIVKIDVFPF